MGLGRWSPWLERVPVLPGSEQAAQRWGELIVTALRAGRPIPANDGWIAACCLEHGAPLATLSLRHYAEIDGLEVLGVT